MKRGIHSLFVVLALFAGCASDPIEVQSRSPEQARPDDFDLYAFSSHRLQPDEPELDGARRDFQEALRGALARFGLIEAKYGDSPLLIDFELKVVENQRNLDPNFAFHSIEKFEEGLVHMRFRSNVDNQVIWEGRSKLRLRALARGAGVTSVNWTPVNEERSWRIEELLDALIRDSGLGDHGSDRSRAEKSLSREARRDFFKRLYEVLPEKKIEITHEEAR